MADYDGFGPGNRMDDRIIWEEANRCSGLQRIRESACATADRALVDTALP